MYMCRWASAKSGVYCFFVAGSEGGRMLKLLILPRLGWSPSLTIVRASWRMRSICWCFSSGVSSRRGRRDCLICTNHCGGVGNNCKGGMLLGRLESLLCCSIGLFPWALPWLSLCFEGVMLVWGGDVIFNAKRNCEIERDWLRKWWESCGSAEEIKRGEGWRLFRQQSRKIIIIFYLWSDWNLTK